MDEKNSGRTWACWTSRGRQQQIRFNASTQYLASSVNDRNWPNLAQQQHFNSPPKYFLNSHWLILPCDWKAMTSPTTGTLSSGRGHHVLLLPSALLSDVNTIKTLLKYEIQGWMQNMHLKLPELFKYLNLRHLRMVKVSFIDLNRSLARKSTTAQRLSSMPPWRQRQTSPIPPPSHPPKHRSKFERSANRTHTSLLVPYLFDLAPWALIKYFNLESGRLFEAERLLNLHHFQQVENNR